MDKILRAIRHFSPGCFNPDKRKKEIYTLFVYFCCRIADDYAANSEYKQIFSEVGSFDSVLCISTDLFNFSHNTLSADYYEYCGIFGVSVLSAFKLINWFGRNAELPKGMAVYLFNIEKKIVIHDIWEDGLGYQLITSNSQKYSNLAILKRLRLHSLERVREICHVAALD